MDGTTLAVVILALAFGYLNGALSSGSLVATAISSRSLGPRPALALASAAVFVGPFVFGTSVAQTLGAGLLQPGVANLNLVAGALIGAAGWNALAIALGWPTSASHALVGGLVGAALMRAGPEGVTLSGLAVVLGGLVLGPAAGMVAGYLFMRLIVRIFRGASPSVSVGFRRGQPITLIMLALSHGTNDAQKTMAVISLALVGAGEQSSFSVPPWVVAASAGALALGVATGGSRVIRTLGGRLFRMRPVHAFSSQASSGLAILAATALGWPVSTAQVVSSSIVGVGSAHRASAVRWRVARGIITAWVVTMPAAGFAAGGAYWVLSRI